MAQKGEHGEHWLTYRELAEQLPAYAADMGFTHVELLPVMEHPFDGSWGYQPTGLFAPTSRFGTPADFAAWSTPATQPESASCSTGCPGISRTIRTGSRSFDGTALYEHADPCKGATSTGTRSSTITAAPKSRISCIANALFWLDRYTSTDCASMRSPRCSISTTAGRRASWIPNKYGGRENIEAIDFLRRTNTSCLRQLSRTRPPRPRNRPPGRWCRGRPSGGLGFGYKWNMGWMHDTLEYIRKDPIHRRHHHGNILFGLHYAFSENFILPLSHDEVVHGKRSILGRMPGETGSASPTCAPITASCSAIPARS